ncbi:hypothetical protein D1007_11940 [Hordeum vulgare]|nr:hypothetical protein D1007_11940 [Hordeum vulgare]
MPPSSQPKRPASALAPHLASASELAPQAASALAPQAGPAPPPAGPVAPLVRPASALLLRPAPPRPAAGRPRPAPPPAAPPRLRPARPRPAHPAIVLDSDVNANVAHPEAAKFRYAPLAEEEKMSEVFDNCCVTNEHARVPTPSYQGDPSRIIVEDDSGCESQDCQVTTIQNRGKSGKKRASPYSPSPKMNDKWAGENAKNEAFVGMVDLFSARDKRDAEESARDKREAEERAREKREPEESVDQTRQEIQHMMAMVEADGAKPGSDEHFYATFLFMEKKYHDVFSSFTAHEPIARLGWIKRMWQLNNK